MAITVSGNTIETIDYNEANIDTVTYNGTVVFETLVDYTFPNANAKKTSDKATNLGIATYYDTRNSSSQSAYNAFDNDLSTAFARWVESPTSQKFGRISIVFPFPICIQSITIKNTSIPLNDNGVIGGLKKGNIYISPDVAYGNFVDGSNTQYNASGNAVTVTGYTYDTLDRSNYSAASAATTHTNSDYASTPIRSICIYGTEWFNSNWHAIGEVEIAFKVGSGLLASWKSTYGIS